MEESADEKIEVHIVYLCSTTKPNEKVRLVGSIEQLGSWNPDKGVDLITDASSYPQWIAHISLPCSAVIEYKYVVVDMSTNLLVRWEALNNNANRVMNIADVGHISERNTKGAITVFEEEGSLDSKINYMKFPKQQSMSNIRTAGYVAQKQK